MRKPSNRKVKVPTPFFEEDYGQRTKKALKNLKPPKRIRLQDLDLDDEI
jgi:hypothetical protein